LQKLLEELCAQQVEGAFTYSIVIVDNDRFRSAESVVSAFAASSRIPISYHLEPQQNIALARNKAVASAEGDFVAFMDDDEVPLRNWLLTLFRACEQYKAAGVLGPVKCSFGENVPGWVVKGKFYERATYPTGFVIDGRKGRTNNTLLRREVFADVPQPFRPEFRTGEDQDFFTRMIAKGHVFIWCDQAIVYEFVPPTRWKRSFMLRRALLRGATAPVHPSFGAADVAKSCVAVPLYTLGLPFALLRGQASFMKLLVKLFDHFGKLFALVGINLIKEPYVTE